jgi:hypothetical protein
MVWPVKTHPAQSTGPEGKKNSGDGENFSLDFSFYRTSTITPFELSRWRGGRCAYAQIEAGVPPRNCTCLSVVMRCSIEPLPYPFPVRSRQIPVGRWYESTETLFKFHMVTRPQQAPAAHFKRLP